MAEESVISALYPPPPPYIKFFTDENEAKLEEYKKQNDDLQEDQLKEEDKQLRFLIPPKQPEGENYRSFGEIWNFNDKIPQLEDMGIPKLYRESDKTDNHMDGQIESQHRITELKRLLKSLLLNFLEIVGVMGVNPSEFGVKVEHIRTILINIHHLLNEYRPHQSRESLILLLEKQISTKRDEIKEMEKICKEVEEKVNSLVKVYVDGEKQKEIEPEVQQEQEKQGTVQNFEEDNMDLDEIPQL